MSDFNEKLNDQELIAAVEELLRDKATIEAFDLPVDELKKLMNVKVGGKGFSLSPNFKSAGWGENDTDALMIEMSDIANGKAILKHELRHALHCLVCTHLFNDDLTTERLQKFVTNVLDDPGFYEWRKDLNGEAAEKQWREVRALAEKGDLDEIIKNSLKFGSILYQHAYYLDPLMCEAAASTNDTGFAEFNGTINRFVALYVIPGEQVLEGYGWKEAQTAFAKAPMENKAMFMNKANYNRKKCFGVE
jgi:hypothetical protein